MFNLFKRIFELIITLIILVFLSPIMMTIALLIRIKLGPSVIFKQRRIGLNRKIFTLYKFRTMNEETDKNKILESDKNRFTKFGNSLRFSSLDELPSLWNVVKGDMSLIGPRPLLEQYLPLYNAHQARRHEIKPGITGWAQINGRNTISWKKRFDLDIWYVDNKSILLDIKIFFKTINKVIKRQGAVYSKKDPTMPLFKGDKDDH
ncbi:sugar transferase [Pelagibacterales bacterium SAG-MED22]|nr:sugar transferase [Pelagibacterales bacterium SAG-MED22]